MTETYEQLRDGATGEAGAAWRAADQEEQSLRTLYQELREDPRYTNAHKAEQAWERYEATKQKIVEGKAKAKELLEEQAHSAERLSLPFPGGEGIISSDTQKSSPPKTKPRASSASSTAYGTRAPKVPSRRIGHRYSSKSTGEVWKLVACRVVPSAGACFRSATN